MFKPVETLNCYPPDTGIQHKILKFRDSVKLTTFEARVLEEEDRPQRANKAGADQNDGESSGVAQIHLNV